MNCIRYMRIALLLFLVTVSALADEDQANTFIREAWYREALRMARSAFVPMGNWPGRQPHLNLPPPQYAAPRVKNAPTIDGLLNEPCWQEAAIIVPPFENLRPWRKGQMPVFLICHDGEQLYVGFRGAPGLKPSFAIGSKRHAFKMTPQGTGEAVVPMPANAMWRPQQFTPYCSGWDFAPDYELAPWVRRKPFLTGPLIHNRQPLVPTDFAVRLRDIKMLDLLPGKRSLEILATGQFNDKMDVEVALHHREGDSVVKTPIAGFTLRPGESREITLTLTSDKPASLELMARVGRRTAVSFYPICPPPVGEVLKKAQSLVRDYARDKATALERLRQERTTLLVNGTAEAWGQLYERALAFRRELAFSNPLINFDKLLFVKRQTFTSSHIYTDHFDGSRRLGGNLCVLTGLRPDGKVRDLVPKFSDGIFGRMDLSFDAKNVIFCHRRPGGGYLIYEVGTDGSNLRQLTHQPDDANQMRKLYGHAYDDMDPVYLPDGNIMFISTRSHHAVVCHNAFTVTNLFVMDSNGEHKRPISDNTSSDMHPSLANDGKVLYCRWEYVDKGSANVQSLWSIHPDGSGSAHVFKNDCDPPVMTAVPRSIPGSHKIVCIAAPHMYVPVGPVIIIDTYITSLTDAAITNITPEIGYPPCVGYGEKYMGYYYDVYPLSEKYFIVSYSFESDCHAPRGYQLYLLDAFGNKELIYRDAKYSCFEPIPLRPRERPPVIPTMLNTRLAKRVVTGANPRNIGSDVVGNLKSEQPMALLSVIDIYEGMPNIPRGAVKYIRVVEDEPKPWCWSNPSPRFQDSLGLQNPVVSLGGHFAIKKVYGLVQVKKDGSAYFKVPAMKNLYFQALDKNYMELQRMRSFVNLQPGEIRSCTGCHEPRNEAPPDRDTIAMREPPADLMPPVGWRGPMHPHYDRDVQPIFDKHCIQCHGSKEPEAGLDLTGTETRLFSVSYENLIRRHLVNKVDVTPRGEEVELRPPLSFGSHRSRIVKILRKGHYDVKLSRMEWINLVRWIDCNAHFYGTYKGRRNIKWKGRPDYRPFPEVASVSMERR